MSDIDFTVVPVRPCAKCGTAERYKNGKCKSCANAGMAAYRAANPDKVKAQSAARYVNHPDKVKAANAAWRAANPDKRRAIDAVWRANNPDKVAAMKAAWYAANVNKVAAKDAARRAANPDKHKAASAAWRAVNPEAQRIYKQNRRALKKKAGGILSTGLAATLFKLQKGKCPCCAQPLGDDYHLDHKMPLALGGANEDGNMQLLTATCNMQKHKKHPVDFMQSRGFLL